MQLINRGPERWQPAADPRTAVSHASFNWNPDRESVLEHVLQLVVHHSEGNDLIAHPADPGSR